MRYWLLKTEPAAFSIDDLAALPHATDHWDGVRNYQARNLLRDELQVGDQALFYHSNANPPGVIGIVEVVRSGYPDHTAFDPDSKYYDPRSDPSKPRWFMVDVALVRKFSRLVSLSELKADPVLSEMVLVQRSRLSVQPVRDEEFAHICALAERPAPSAD